MPELPPSRTSEEPLEPLLVPEPPAVPMDPFPEPPPSSEAEPAPPSVTVLPLPLPPLLPGPPEAAPSPVPSVMFPVPPAQAHTATAMTAANTASAAIVRACKATHDIVLAFLFVYPTTRGAGRHSGM